MLRGSMLYGLGIAGFVLGLAGCSGIHQKPIDESTPKLSTFTKEEIEQNAEALLTEMKNVGDEIRLEVKNRLKELLADPEFAPKIESPGVSAVGAYNVGSGGMVLAMGSGNGLVNFAGGSQKRPVEITGIAAGATVGGGGSFGVVLAVGLEYEEKFPDRYNVVLTGVTVGGKGYRVGSGQAEQGTHSLHFCASGRGFALDAGGAMVTILMKDN